MKLKQNTDTPAPLVSVIVPVYRRASTVADCIQSVLAQDVSLEVIAIADGCKESVEALREIPKDPRLRIIDIAVNQGAARTRNHGLKLARGTFVAHLDADDRLLPGALARVLDRFKRPGTELDRAHVGLVYGDLVLEDATGRSRGVLEEPAFPGESAFLRQPFETPFIVARRSVLEQVGGSDEGAIRCWNSGIIARVARRLAVDKVPGGPLVTHRVDGKNQSLHYRPPDCSRCASATSCQLANTRRRAANRDVHALRKLSLVLTTRCNLDCEYCFTRRYKWDLKLEDALRLIVQAKDHGAKLVGYTGGEPSLYEHFDEVVYAAADLGMETLVISNGWSWSDERIQRFVSLPGVRLGLSLEGRDAKVHDAIRGKNAYAALMKFLDRMRAAKPDLPTMGIVIATKDNIHLIEDIADWAMNDLKLDHLRIDRVVPSGNAEFDDEFSPEDTQRFLAAGRQVAARWPGRVEALVDNFSSEGCPLYIGLENGIHDLQVFSDGTVPSCVYMHMDRPTRVGMASQDVDELIAKPNVQRVKQLIDVAFDDRERQIGRKGLFTCVECMERRNKLDREGQWPGQPGLLSLNIPARGIEPVGRPRSAAERSGILPPSLVFG